MINLILLKILIQKYMYLVNIKSYLFMQFNNYKDM
jgi:hypothetical protein